MEQSILKSTKEILGIVPENNSFDLAVITHINSAFSDLADIGIGDEDGFVIEDETVEWSAFISDDSIKLSKVKTCVYLHTRLLFDPPVTSFHLNAMQEQLKEHQWRLNVNREDSDWVNPDPPAIPNQEA